MKKISLYLLTLLLLLTSIPTGYAIEKGDDQGEVLNLPPFVDFEIKEKRKVDVIVDVGNTSKTMDEINSLVNEVLRPALAADGLDYKIHVEKSSEGKTRQYYGLYEANSLSSLFDRPLGLYYFDVETGENVRVSDTALDIYSAYLGNAYMLEDERTIIYSSSSSPIRITHISEFDPNKLKFGTIQLSKNGVCPSDGSLADPSQWMQISTTEYGETSGAPIGTYRNDFTITANGELALITNGSSSYDCNRPMYQLAVLDNINEFVQKLDMEQTEWKDSIHTGNGSPFGFPYYVATNSFRNVAFRFYTTHNHNDLWGETTNAKRSSKAFITKDGGLYITFLNNLIRYYESFDAYVQSQGLIQPDLEYSYNRSLGSDVRWQTFSWRYNGSHPAVRRNTYNVLYETKLNPATEDLIFREVIDFSHSSSHIYTLSKINKKTGEYIRGTTNKDARAGSSLYRPITAFQQWLIMQDGTIIAPSTHYADMQRKIVLLSDVDAEPVFIELPEDAPFRPAQMISSLGRYIIFQGDSSTAFFYSFNIDTLEWAVAAPYIRSTGNNKNYAGMIFYPDFVSSERRYMIDILQENLVRSDAEKYYIRIDDTVLSQLNNPKALAHLATEMLAQQMTYISLGTTSNEILHKRLLTTINNKGRFINNSNQRAAMTQAADLITNRKEAEVHVLMANETIPLSTIKSNLAVMQAELQAENILSTVNYIQGTSTSKLFELVNRIEWNDDRNNYVVMFNRG
ncbi:hypothetical protein ACFP56_18330, partial [Paenibacillus septentrionalis]